jgi:hypothetical protein
MISFFDIKVCSDGSVNPQETKHYLGRFETSVNAGFDASG